jgi:Protein of unknown function (DUF1214)
MAFSRLPTLHFGFLAQPLESFAPSQNRLDSKVLKNAGIVGHARDPLWGAIMRSAHGSMDVYFGPKALDGMEANWVPTADGGDWFPYFRFYGPQKRLFGKTWKLPDIEQIS